MIYPLGLLIFFAAVLYYRHKTWSALPWPQKAIVPARYQGHRGYWIEGDQENTLAAFRTAQQKGLQMIEMDVRLSRDNIPVVFHDEDLKRIGGLPEKVSALLASQLREKVNAPFLEEVLQDSTIPPLLNIELKTTALWDGTLEKRVAAKVIENKAQGRVLFSSFNPVALWRMSRLLPEVPRALLASKVKESVNRFYLRHLLLAPYVRIHALHLDHLYVTCEEIKKWKLRKVPVSLWTVNDPERAEEFLQAGALSIISDRLPAQKSAL